ncbi:35513_t:CDS:1, partial [Gigaspora margarita]
GSIKSWPHHLSELAIRLFSIYCYKQTVKKIFQPSSGLLGINVHILKLISSKEWPYNMTNIRDELTYFDAKLTEFELHKMVKLETINNNIDNCLDDHIVDEVNENNNIFERDLF